MELGDKIRSLKLELDKNLNTALESMCDRKRQINQEVEEINARIDELNKEASHVDE